MLKAQKYQLVCPVELSALSLQLSDNFQSKNWVSMADFHHPRLIPNHFRIPSKANGLLLFSGMLKHSYRIMLEHFNRRHRRYGHLSQNHYQSIVFQKEVGIGR